MSLAVYRYLPAVAEEIPLLVSIPHTGTYIPSEIVTKFADPVMATGVMTDWHLHELYAFLPQLGIDVFHATHHRFVVDLNRPPDATPLYPGRFETGLVPTQTFQGERIWREPPSPEEIQSRLANYHRPYHEALARRLREKAKEFGRCYLIDAHSVASRANRLHGALTEDIYLGDRDGTTCDREFTTLAREAFNKKGLKVSLNRPYKGGYITAHYPGIEGVQTLQIEMCQHLYMQEGQPNGAVGSAQFESFQRTLRQVIETIADAVRAPQLKC